MKHVQGTFLLPIVRDDIHGGGCLNPDVKLSPAPVSSNGYYGYQAVPGDHVERMDAQPCEEGIQFNNMIESEARPVFPREQQYNCWSRNKTRKRGWEDGADAATRDFKRRRENEPMILVQPTPPKYPTSMKQPTHNMPDMPRCIMGHYI